MAATDNVSFHDLVEGYDKAASKYPLVKTALDLAPGTGTATAIADTAASLSHGKYGDAALDALGAVPFVGSAVKAARLGRKAVSAVDKVTDLAKNTRSAVSTGEKVAKAADTTAKGRSVTIAGDNLQAMPDSEELAYRGFAPIRRGAKTGGVVKTHLPKNSTRGGGCETKGKSKGRFV
jgi:hypothetical protein